MSNPSDHELALISSFDNDLEHRLRSAALGLSSPLPATSDLLTILDKTQFSLSLVDQSPSKSVFMAIYPVRNALADNHLVHHSDIEVRLAVAYCIVEVMRITFPDAPYGNATMKVIVKLIVQVFEGLDDEASPLFEKRVSILEMVAGSRLCDVMVDLGCDDLIVDMFRGFLRTIRPGHRGVVFSSMEVVMTRMVEQFGNGVFPELIGCLIDCVKEDGKEVLPIARRLAGKVICSCAGTLKSFLMQIKSHPRLARQQMLDIANHTQEFLISEAIRNMTKEVELCEEKSKVAKVEATKAFQDILSKVEEARQMTRHEEDANAKLAGRVYAEKAILATEARGLMSQFHGLSAERIKFPPVIDEVYEALEERLAAAEAGLAATEQERMKNEEWGYRLLTEQQLLLENMVEQSTLLKQEEEENAKFRELLIDGGRIFDDLQDGALFDLEHKLCFKKRIRDKCRRLTN